MSKSRIIIACFIALVIVLMIMALADFMMFSLKTLILLNVVTFITGYGLGFWSRRGSK